MLSPSPCRERERKRGREREREREMGEESLKFYGTRCSLYCIMVEMARKLKGLTYECVEEDLSNKSADLLQYNPIQKKVPVLFHDGEPLVESLLIVQYIDETWTHPPLLPASPRHRARVRFKVNFFFRKVPRQSSLSLSLSLSLRWWVLF